MIQMYGGMVSEPLTMTDKTERLVVENISKFEFAIGAVAYIIDLAARGQL